MEFWCLVGLAVLAMQGIIVWLAGKFAKNGDKVTKRYED